MVCVTSVEQSWMEFGSVDVCLLVGNGVLVGKEL